MHRAKSFPRFSGLMTSEFSYKVLSRKSGILCCRLEWRAPDHLNKVLTFGFRGSEPQSTVLSDLANQTVTTLSTS